MKPVATFDDLINEANTRNLYGKLLAQLQKDFMLANVHVEISEDMTPDGLKAELHETVFHLIQQKFNDYLNLLYVIDVPEKDIKQLDGSDMTKLSGQVTFLILKREWQKVWYKANY